MTYDVAHRNVKYRRGSARKQKCAHCGTAASQWAYDHADPFACRSPAGLLFSEDITHYLPLCTRCHLAFDRGADFGRFLAEVLDEVCPRCEATPGRPCRTAKGVEMVGLAAQHVPRKRRRLVVDWTPEMQPVVRLRRPSEALG